MTGGRDKVAIKKAKISSEATGRVGANHHKCLISCPSGHQLETSRSQRKQVGAKRAKLKMALVSISQVAFLPQTMLI